MTEPIDAWVWTGDSLPSKKNSKRIIQRYGKPSIISSKEYIEWENGFVAELKSLKRTIGTCKKCTIRISSPDLRRFDLSNKVESVNDAMVKAGYLTDDSWDCIPSLTIEYGGKTEDKTWKVEAEFF